MNKKNWASVVLLVALVLSMPVAVSAITLEFQGGTFTGNIGPYTMAIQNDVAITGPPSAPAFANGTVLMICNDFAGRASTSFDPWEVQKHILVAGANPGTPGEGTLLNGATNGVEPSTRAKFFDATGNQTSPGTYVNGFLKATEVDYRAGAYLSSKIFAAYESNDTSTATIYQRALWSLFNSNASETGWNFATYAAQRAEAYTVVNRGWQGWQQYVVYTKVPLLNAPPGGIQEFYARVPEAASFASLGLYFGGLGLLGYAFRRRMK